MAITRATQRFRELAERTEAIALERGIVVVPDVIDQLLNAQVAHVAELMGISPRTALGYTPDDFPLTLADAIAATHTQ